MQYSPRNYVMYLLIISPINFIIANRLTTMTVYVYNTTGSTTVVSDVRTCRLVPRRAY